MRNHTQTQQQKNSTKVILTRNQVTKYRENNNIQITTYNVQDNANETSASNQTNAEEQLQQDKTYRNIAAQ